ncbi:MAG: phosphoribosylglycinamide formyltransferase [Clostridiales bacterium]|nr:phosphoribosylglycinamide formyltransferase [Clostridiales bacterium]
MNILTEKYKIAVLASGRGSNLQALIDHIAADPGSLIKIALVASDQPDAQVLIRAKAAGIPTLVLIPRDYPDKAAYEQALAERIERAGVKLVVLAGFMRMLSPIFLEKFTNKVINIHPSLLPAFPGLKAQEQALQYGVKISGCTVHFVDTGMDSGPIIAQKAVPVLADDNPETLAERILEQEHILYPQVIEWLTQGRVVLDGRRVRIKVGGLE